MLGKLFKGDRKKSTTSSQQRTISYEELEKEFAKMVAELRLPAQAAQNMLKMPQAQKIEMLKAHKVKKQTQKQGQSGKEWASKFSSVNGASATDAATIEALQKFIVVLKDSDHHFVNDFISELGLNHICHLGSRLNVKFDHQLLLAFKGIIDAQQSVTSLINHSLVILLIVQKIDSQDTRVRELALQLLVSLVAVDSKYTIKAVDDIMSALSGQANGFYGSRNRWKPLIEHLNSSSTYDVLCVTLINFLLGSLDSVEARIEERRVLNSEQFEHILRTMEEGIERSVKKHKTNKYASLSAQIEAYWLLSKQDFEITTELNNPNKLFELLQKQVLKDGYINELTSILNNLITIPARANNVWQNISRIVGQACLPVQKKMLERGTKKDNKYKAESKENNYKENIQENKENKENNVDNSNNSAGGGISAMSKDLKRQASAKQTQNRLGIDSRLRAASRGKKKFDDVRRFDYPTYAALKLLLNVKEQEDDYVTSEVANQLKSNLENERLKTLKFEKDIKKLKENVNKLEMQLKTQQDANMSLHTEIESTKKKLSAAIEAAKVAHDKAIQAAKTQATVVNKTTDAPADTAVKTEKAVAAAGIDDDNKENKDGKSIKSNPVAAMLAASLEKKKENDSIASISQAIVTGDDGYNKYRKMLKMGIPKQGVANKMIQDKIDKDIIEKFEETGVLPNGNAIASSSSSNANAKPAGGMAALAAAIKKKAAAPLPAPPFAPKLPGKKGGKPKLTEEEEAKVVKYRKMLKMGLPEQSVMNKMTQDKIDQSLIDKMFDKGSVSGGSSVGIGRKAEKKEPELPENLAPMDVIVPNVKMRNLHWQKVSPFDVEKTVWGKINTVTKENKVAIDTSSLESLFCQKVNKKGDSKEKSKSKKGGKSRKAAADTVSILDSKRSYNVEIFLGRMRMDNWSIREGMLSMNETIFNRETIEKFINFVPTPEEAQLLDAYEDEPIENLGKAERFFKIVKSVDTNLKERLQLWLFKLSFQDKLNVEKEKIEALKAGANAISSSNNFITLLSVILAIGNYMNGNTKKGRAYGFKIASLTQLTRSRAVDNSQTLLEYLFVFLLNHENEDYKNSLQFCNDLKCLDNACSVDLPQLRKNMADINVKLRKINNRIIKSEKNDEIDDNIDSDQFVIKMKPFYTNAITEYENAKKFHSDVLSILKNTGILLNEPKDINCEFLKTINNFRKEFIKTEKMYYKKQEKAKKDALRAQRRAEKQAKLDAKKNKQTSANAGANANANNKKASTNSAIANSITEPATNVKVSPPPVPPHVLIQMSTSSIDNEDTDDVDVDVGDDGDNDDQDNHLLTPGGFPAMPTSLTDSIVQGLRATHNSADFLAKLAARRNISSQREQNLLNETPGGDQ